MTGTSHGTRNNATSISVYDSGDSWKTPLGNAFVVYKDVLALTLELEASKIATHHINQLC